LILPTDEAIDQLIATFDTDRDGQINYQEFVLVVVVDRFIAFFPLLGGIL
jgi:Ca2+-binding EF-hand superfamily protein